MFKSFFAVVSVLLLTGCADDSLRPPRDFPTAPHTATFGQTIIDDGHDLIFPSLIQATKHFKNPLAKYYLYTSPHGGADIRLYISNKIEGPWKLHKRVVDEKIARVDHTSSPHAVWNEQAGELFLYVHAPNAQTIVCRSKNGVDFEFGQVCVTREMINEVIDFTSRSASYARVHKYTIPEYGNKWTMTLAASGGDKKKNINRSASVLCTSDDGLNWVARRKIIDDQNGGRDYKSLDNCWLPINGENYMIYGLRTARDNKDTRTEPVRLHLSKGDANWRHWQCQGIFYDVKADYPDEGAARGFSWTMTDDGPVYLYEAGQNRGARIATLKLDD
jgi:hypothetical protein